MKRTSKVKIKLMTDEYGHEYTIKFKETDKEKILDMKRSKNETCWTGDAKGEHLYKMLDDGNGIKINDMHFDYDEFYDLLTAMKFFNKLSGGIGPKYTPSVK